MTSARFRILFTVTQIFIEFGYTRVWVNLAEGGGSVKSDQNVRFAAKQCGGHSLIKPGLSNN